MNLQQRRSKVIDAMKEQGVDLLPGFHDNGHFIVTDEGGHHAIVSAMVAVTASGDEVLWSS